MRLVICPECRTVQRICRSQVRTELSCGECQTVFFVVKKKRRKAVGRSPRTADLGLALWCEDFHENDWSMQAAVRLLLLLAVFVIGVLAMVQFGVIPDILN